MKKFLLYFLLLFPLYAIPQFVGDGSDGSYSVSGVENFHSDLGVATSYVVSDINIWANSIDVNYSGDFSVDDLIVIIQMDGVDAGKFDFKTNRRISSIVGNTIYLTKPMDSSFSTLNSIQICKIPEYQNFTINVGNTLTCNGWDGNTGGIIWFYANGTVTINGNIDVDGLGFYGGNGGSGGNGASSGGDNGNGGNGGSGAPGNGLFGADGANGIVGGSQTIGSIGNVGVSGNGPDGGFANGGGGGNSTSTDFKKIIMGSGGGGGKGANGGNGGGAGGDGDSGTNGVNGQDGGNGGNGGGIVIIYAEEIIGNGIISAIGGNGSDGGDGGNGGDGGDGARGNNGSSFKVSGQWNCLGAGGGGGGGNAGNGGDGGGAGGGGAGGAIRIAGVINTFFGSINVNGGNTGNSGSGGISGDVGSGGNGGNKGGGSCTESGEDGEDGNNGISGLVGLTGINGTNGKFLSNTELPLPIELLYFKGTYIETGNLLEWATACEINNDYFIVECSTDGYNFKEITKIKGQGNSIVKNEYELIDNGINTLLYDVTYYRLKQVDFDETYTYSNIISINNFYKENLKQMFTVYPNPSDGERINIELKGFNEKEKIFVVVIDVYGKTLYSNVIIIGKSGNAVIVIDYDKNLPVGIYIISGSTNDVIYSRKLIVQ